jgi:hypothetical protein
VASRRSSSENGLDRHALGSIPLRSSSGTRDAHDAQAGLDRAELTYERLPSLAEEHPDDQNVDLNPAHDLERLERILGCQDAVAGRTQRLIDQFLDGCVLLEHEDRRGTRCSHAAIVVRRRLTTLDPDGSVGRS